MERGESRSPFDGAPFDRLRAGRTNGVGVIRPSTGSLRLAQGGQDERPGRSVLLRPFDPSTSLRAGFAPFDRLRAGRTNGVGAAPSEDAEGTEG